jgi:hypothetical protein
MIRRAAKLAVLASCAALFLRAALADPPMVPAPPPNPPAPTAVPSGPAPHIKFDSVTVNLGDVVRGEDAVATFTYHNTGDVPLHILSAKPG